MSDDIERIARAWYARFHAKDWNDQSAASRQFMVHATEELVASARDALGLTASDLAGLAEGTHVVVPVADLERVALIAEYDYPGDAPEFCGMLCQLCGGLDGHEPECVLAARLAALLFALAAKVEGERADA